MKNILKRVIFPLMLTPTIVAPLAVTACAVHNFADDVDVTDLGFVENLSSETIMKAFSKKNPRVKVKNFLYVRGNSHQGWIANFPQGYYQGITNIPITYKSKLEYSQENKEQYEISNENDSIIIDFNILDNSYDKDINDEISCFPVYESRELKTFTHQIDKATGKYQITISLNNLKTEFPESLSKNFGIVFRWGDENENRGYGITLGTIKIEIKN